MARNFLSGFIKTRRFLATIWLLLCGPHAIAIEITHISPDRGWEGGTRASGEVVPGTLIVIEGSDFLSDAAQNQVTFAGAGGARIAAPVVWAAPSAVKYQPAGILDDSDNYTNPMTPTNLYIAGLQRSSGIAVRREFASNRFYLAQPTFETSAAAVGSLGTVKYPLGGFNFWTMLNFSGHAPYRFDRPTGVAVDADGQVYVTNRFLHRVETYTENLGTNSAMAVWGGQGAGTNQFNSPQGIDVASIGGTNFVFVADTGNRRVVRTRTDGSAFTAMAVPASAGLIESVAAHSSGRVYATDRERGRLLRFDGATGQFLSIFADDDLNHPVAVDVDNDGYVYVIDGRWVKKFDPDGMLLTRFGYTDSADPLEQLPPEALHYPQDLAVVADGSVLVADSTLTEGHVSQWRPTDARELWVHVPQNAVTGPVRVQNSNGTAGYEFIVLHPGPVSVTGWSVSQGIGEYPLVAGKRTAVIAELSRPYMPVDFGVDTFGSPVTDFAELAVMRDGDEVFKTSEFEISGIEASEYTEVKFLVVFEVPVEVLQASGNYRFALTLMRDNALAFAESSTRAVTRRRSPRVGAVVLSHLRADGSPGLGDPVNELVFPIPSFDPVFVSWFDLTEMFRGFLNFNRYYPVPTRLSDVWYLGAMPITGLADGVTAENARDILEFLEGVRITLNEDGSDYEALAGLIDRDLIVGNYAGMAPFDSSERSALVSIDQDQFDPQQTEPDIGANLAHEVGHVNGVVPAGPRRDGNAPHSRFVTVLSAGPGWDTRRWSFVRLPEAIMHANGASVDGLGLFEGAVANRDGVTDDGDYGHLFDRFANPHPKQEHYIETPLLGKARPSGSASNLHVVGRFFADRVVISRLFRGSATTPITPRLASDYEIVQLDRANRVLHRHPIHPVTYADGPLTDTQRGQSFRVSVPLLSKASRIAFMHGGKQLGVIDLAGRAPSVQLMPPTVQHDRVELRWRGQFSGKHASHYRLDYSRDGGKSFDTVALLGSDAAAFTVRFADLPGARRARLRIVAVDTLRESAALSPIFSVPDKAPDVHIVSPRPGQYFAEGRAIRAEAMTVDREDGAIEGSQMRWTLDQHIEICIGTECPVRTISVPTPVGELTRLLPVGPHTLTVTATDKAGNVTKSTVTFLVGKDSDGDGVSDEAESASGTDPRDPLVVPGGVRYQDFFEWLVRAEDVFRRLRIINPTPDPLMMSLVVRSDQGLDLAGIEATGCGDSIAEVRPLRAQRLLSIPAGATCSIRLRLPSSTVPAKVTASLGIRSGGNGPSLEIAAHDEGINGCDDVGRRRGECRARTRTLQYPARLIDQDRRMPEPGFANLSQLGALARIALPGAAPQSKSLRLESELRSITRALQSTDARELINGLLRSAQLGAAAAPLAGHIGKSVNHRSAAVQSSAIGAIGRVGVRDESMIRKLRKLSRAKDASVASAAREALKRLGAEDSSK